MERSMISLQVVLLRLGLAVVLGILVGVERSLRQHSAGMRTNALVSLGCALFTIISGYSFTELLHLNHIQLDPTRIASYIVAGIGFLGGGAIYVLRDRERVKGLTTAAAIWVVAAIGMACGAGMLWEATIATLFAVIVLYPLHKFEKHFLPPREEKQYRLQVHIADGNTDNLLGTIYAMCAKKRLAIGSLEIKEEQAERMIVVICRARDIRLLAEALDLLRTLEGVSQVKMQVQDEWEQNM